jgi:ATP-dependent exoDNAse (exonuclease V) beta subunit
LRVGPQDVLTEEQARIVGAYVEPGECLLVEAYAGTGKTFTLRAYAASMAGRYPNKK